MEECSQGSSELAETEPLSESGYETQSQSQSQTQSEPDYWGRLYPLKTTLEAFDLVRDSYSFGHGADVDVEFSREQIPEGIFKKCSKKHFKIERQQINVMGALTTRIVLIDTSCNGTYINGHVLKKNRKKALSTNDVIGLPAGKPSAYEVYVFIDALMHPRTTVPYTVRKLYQVSLRLGSGTFGEVSLVFNKINKRPFAMKAVTYKEGAMLNSCTKKLLNELDILQTVNHPNVIKLVDVINCKNEHFLILEYMDGKDLSHKINDCQRLKEDTTKLYFYQICSGIKYLHSIGIIHRDIKPANILLASSNDETLVKLTDFGLSKVLSSSTMMKTLCGTKMYVAPEVLVGAGSFEYTNQVDIWSLGVMLYVCLSGVEPFSSEPENIEELIKEAITSPSPSIWSSISTQVKTLIDSMLVQDPEERIKIHEVLSDKWFQGDCEMLAKANALYNSSENQSLSETLTMSSYLSLEDGSSVLNSSFDSDVTSPVRKKLRRD